MHHVLQPIHHWHRIRIVHRRRNPRAFVPGRYDCRPFVPDDPRPVFRHASPLKPSCAIPI